MADNKTGKDASGATFTYGTREIDLVNYPYVYLGTEVGGIWVPYSSANPIPAEIVSGTVSLTGENHIGEVGGSCAVITPTITVTAGAYTAADVVGGELTLTDAMRTVSGSGVLQDIMITTLDGELFECTILIFDSAPGAAIADNGVWAWTAGDHAKLLGKVEVVAADYDTYGGDAIAHLRNLGIVVKANGTDDLFAYIIATGTPTFAATSDLQMRFKFLRD